MYTLRPLTLADIPRLVQINPTFTAQTVIRVKRIADLPFAGWHFYEERLPIPFDKKDGYEFDASERANITNRYQQGNCLLEVLERQSDGQLVGVLDVEEEHWRRTAWIWNLMLDISVRGQGLGRQLFERTLAWAKGRKLRAILLETQSNNTPACHFYAHLGFKLVGVNDLFYTNHDVEDDEVALFWGYPL